MPHQSLDTTRKIPPSTQHGCQSIQTASSSCTVSIVFVLAPTHSIELNPTPQDLPILTPNSEYPWGTRSTNMELFPSNPRCPQTRDGSRRESSLLTRDLPLPREILHRHAERWNSSIRHPLCLRRKSPSFSSPNLGQY
jgi:hypothetical protein